MLLICCCAVLQDVAPVLEHVVMVRRLCEGTYKRTEAVLTYFAASLKESCCFTA